MKQRIQIFLVNAFDAAYGWEIHHIMNDIAKGEKEMFLRLMHTWIRFQKNGKQMIINYYSHQTTDENSWAGTEYERMGDAVETFAALTYTLPWESQ